jgi:hypothetical protein
MTRAVGRPAPARMHPADPAGGSYFHRATLPLASLLFLLPLIIIYEIGVRHYPVHPLFASKHIQDFFLLWGATGRYLPPLAVLAILLAWHIARHDSWRVRPAVLGGMILECVALVAPLVLCLAALRQLWPLMAGVSDVSTQIIFSLGAGIYEELIFRLVAFTLLDLLLVDTLKIPRPRAIGLIVLIPALLFSAYHYLGNEAFSYHTFAIRTLGGVYFGVIFLFRGFGITAGTHAAYNIFVILLQPRG